MNTGEVLTIWRDVWRDSWNVPIEFLDAQSKHNPHIQQFVDAFRLAAKGSPRAMRFVLDYQDRLFEAVKGRTPAELGMTQDDYDATRAVFWLADHLFSVIYGTPEVIEVERTKKIVEPRVEKKYVLIGPTTIVTPERLSRNQKQHLRAAIAEALDSRESADPQPQPA